jgi:hypothetical protein
MSVRDAKLFLVRWDGTREELDVAVSERPYGVRFRIREGKVLWNGDSIEFSHTVEPRKAEEKS